MNKNHLTLSVLLLIVLNDLVDTAANLLMKKGFIRAEIDTVNLGSMAEFAMRSSSSAFLWVGIALFMLNFFIWIAILYKVDLSIAMPIGSFSYIFVPVSAIFFLHEHVSMLRWIGVVFIISGIYFVYKSKKPRLMKGHLTDG